MSHAIQEWIHRLEVGAGVRWLRVLVAVSLLGVLTAAYDFRQFRNLSHPEAMDAAQVGRAIARGEGFTTRYLRPLSVHLLEKQALRAEPEGTFEPVLRGPHPDLANPPVYPLVLAGLMWLVPPEASAGAGATFLISRPDQHIAFLNQVFLVMLVGLTYWVGQRLFEPVVGMLGAVAVAGCQGLWAMSVSGLPLLLLAVWVTALFGCLTALDRGSVQGERSTAWFACRAGLVGLLTALAGLTVYSAFWLILPVGCFLYLAFPGRRAVLLGGMLGVCLLVAGPWLLRNQMLSGLPFGTATYAVLQGTESFPDGQLERSLEPHLEPSQLRSALRKAAQGGVDLLQEVSGLGGSLVPALFLAGLLVRFLDGTRSRLRWLLLAWMLVLGTMQLLVAPGDGGRGTPEAPPALLLVLTPLVMVFGAAMFCLLREQASWRFEGARGVLTGGFVLVALAPLVLVLLQPRRDPRVLPTYFPPWIEAVCRWTTAEELVMSDIPWATAWYGDRKSVPLPRYLRHRAGREDFFAVHDLRHPVSLLYLSPQTVEKPLFSDAFGEKLEARLASAPGSDGAAQGGGDADGREEWRSLVHMTLMEEKVPAGFPLRSAHAGFATRGHLVFADRARWREAAVPLRTNSPAGGS